MTKLKFLLLLSIPTLGFSQSSDSEFGNGDPALGRKYSNEFLNIGVDARALAMSNSVIASVNDVTAGYWNPAGLAQVKDSWQAAAMHAEYFASIAQYEYAGFATPIDDYSSVGVSFIRFGVDGILNTTRLIDENGNVDYDRISEFSAADYALIGSYARQSQSIPNFSFGGNVKIIYRHIGEFANAIGFGFDVGAQYRLDKWQFGATLKDVTTTFNSWSINEEAFGPIFEQTRNERPQENLELTIPRLLAGVGRDFKINSLYSLHTEISADVSFGGRQNTLVSSDVANINPGFGLELGYRGFVFLRSGVGNVMRVRDFNDNESFTVQPNLGVGLNYRGISIDYALTNIGNASDIQYSNIFSLKFDFAGFKQS